MVLAIITPRREAGKAVTGGDAYRAGARELRAEVPAVAAFPIDTQDREGPEQSRHGDIPAVHATA